MKSGSAILFFLFILNFQQLFAANPQYKIILLNKQKIEPVTFYDVDENTLTYCLADEQKQIPLDSIAAITQIRKSRIREGLFVGILTGLTTGIILGKNYVNNTAKNDIDKIPESIVGGVIALGCTAGGALGGGFIGSVIGADKTFQLNHLGKADKIHFISNLIQK